MKNEEYISINKIAELKGLKSNRSLRLAIQKGKYVARVVKVFGGKSYEILYSSLEPEIQRILRGVAECVSQSEQMANDEFDICATVDRRHRISSTSVRDTHRSKRTPIASKPVEGCEPAIIQDEKFQDELIKEATQSNCTVLVPINNINNKNFITESVKLTALARVDIVKALQNMRTKYKTKKEADSVFLDLYNSGMYLPQIYKFVGSISIGTLHRWVKMFDNYGTDGLLQKRKTNKQGEYNTILNEEMKQIFLKYLLHPNKFSIGKAINLTKHILEKRGYENIPCNLTFRRFAENFKKNNYSKWILFREGEKAYHDKVEAYIERDISKLEVGDVLIADGHTLNFQVINPFTGKPTRATLVGFLDWKSTALVGYEIMMSENTQCIASALRNAIINLGMISKVVYQDNGRAFKAKYFHDKQGEKNLSRSLTGARCDFLAQALKNQHTCQSCDCLFGGVKRARSSKAADFSPLPPSRFDEEGFNGIYANLGIKSVFAKPYNARAKVIERFFLEFQEEFGKKLDYLILQAK